MTVSVAMVDCRGRSMPAVFQRATETAGYRYVALGC